MFIQHRQQAQTRGFAVLAPGYQLGQHGIVEGRDAVVLAHAAIHPTPWPGSRFAIQGQRAAGWQKVLLRIFGVQPHLDGVAMQRNLRLGQRQRLAGGHTQLPGDQILPGDRLGDRVLDLQPGVHLHEEEVATRIKQKLYRAGTDITDGLRRLDRCLTHTLAQLGRQAGRGRFFHHLLMPSLDRAVALVQIDRVALAVGKHLNLHVTRL